MLEKLFTIDPSIPPAADAADLLIGSKKVRFSGYDAIERDSVARRLNDFINRPIELFAMYGATKGYSLNDEASTVDAFDVLAVRRIKEMAARVAKVHQHGLHLTLLFQDATELLLTTRPAGLAHHMIDYRRGLTQLVKGMEAPISIVAESEIVGSLTKFIASARENTAIMRRFWDGGEAHRPAGWTGDLDKAFYIKKASGEEGDPVERACLYLGLVRARAPHLPTEPIRVGFSPYPKGLAKMRRVEWKVMDHQSQTIVPWVDHSVQVDDRLVPWRGRFKVNHVDYEGIEFNIGSPV